MIDPEGLPPLRRAIYKWFASLPGLTGRKKTRLGYTVRPFLANPHARPIPTLVSLQKIADDTGQPIPAEIIYLSAGPPIDIDKERLTLAVQIVVTRLCLDNPDELAADIAQLLVECYRLIMMAEHEKGRRLTWMEAMRATDARPSEAQDKQNSPPPKRRR